MSSRLQRSVLMAALACCTMSLTLVSMDLDARGGVHASARVSVHGGGGAARPPGGGGHPITGPPPGGARPPGGPRPPPPPPDRYWNHPVATGMAIATTAAVIGSVIYSLPPSCTKVYVDGVTYQQCGSTWYRPQYAGTSVQYVVVAAPD
jgi:hypothetical protein